MANWIFSPLLLRIALVQVKRQRKTFAAAVCLANSLSGIVQRPLDLSLTNQIRPVSF